MPASASEEKREKLKSIFNKLPEKSINGNVSIDDDLIEFMMTTRPDIEVLSQKAGRPRLFRAGMEAVNFPY